MTATQVLEMPRDPGPSFEFFLKASFHPEISLWLDYSCKLIRKPIRNGDNQKIEVLADYR